MSLNFSFCLFSISSLSTDGSENCRMIKGGITNLPRKKPQPPSTCRYQYYLQVQNYYRLRFDSTTTHDLLTWKKLNRALRPNYLHIHVNLLFPQMQHIIRSFRLRHSHSSQCTSADLNFRCTTALLHLVCCLSFFSISSLDWEEEIKILPPFIVHIVKYPVLLLRSKHNLNSDAFTRAGRSQDRP